MRRRIFVFGSNLKGIHGGGAARFARDEYGAEMGVGCGLTGEAYALPTCGGPGVPLSLREVVDHVDTFLQYARLHPEMDFLVTPVGCGIAGFKVQEVAPLFESAPDNVYLQSRLVNGWD